VFFGLLLCAGLHRLGVSSRKEAEFSEKASNPGSATPLDNDGHASQHDRVTSTSNRHNQNYSASKTFTLNYWA